MSYFVYVLKSSAKERYYIGCTTDSQKRLAEHNAGKTKSTRPFRPWRLVYIEEFSNKRQAYKRGWHLKHPAGYLEKMRIIKSIN